MRKTLLTTVAAAALIATAGMASAQNAQPNAEPKGGAQMKSEAPAARDSGASDKAAPDKAAPKANAQAKPEGDMKAKGAAETKDMNAPAKGSAQSKPDADKAKSAAETKDSAPAKTNAQTAPSNSTNKSATDSKSTTDTKSATDSKSTTDTSKSATDTKSSTSSSTSVSLSTEQRTKIRTTVLQQSNAPRVSKVDFQISVGTKVPRTVRHAPLPPTVVEVYPQWRGYLYFIVGDEIVVVEPNTLEIVAVLQA